MGAGAGEGGKEVGGILLVWTSVQSLTTRDRKDLNWVSNQLVPRPATALTSSPQSLEGRHARWPQRDLKQELIGIRMLMTVSSPPATAWVGASSSSPSLRNPSKPSPSSITASAAASCSRRGGWDAQAGFFFLLLDRSDIQSRGGFLRSYG